MNPLDLLRPWSPRSSLAMMGPLELWVSSAYAPVFWDSLAPVVLRALTLSGLAWTRL